MSNDDGGRRRTSGASLLAVLLAVGFIVVLFAMTGGANVARWMAHGGLGYILGLAIVVGILFLFLLRRRD